MNTAKYDGAIEEDYAKVKVNRKDFDNGDLAFRQYFSTPPMFLTKNLATVPLENIYNGGHAFLIAGGPSFKDIDQDKLNKPGVLTLGINNSVSTFRPNIWTCVDTPANFVASVWLDPKIQKIVPISHIDKKLFDSAKWRNTNTKVGDCPNVIYYRRNEVVNTDQYLIEDTLNWGNHSDIGGGRSILMAAMRMLYIMGIRNLYLLGVDFHMDKDTTYHFDQDRHAGSVNGNMSTYSSMKTWFSELKECFDEVGYNVYNCNPNSKLEVFPHKPFDEAIDLATAMIPQNEKTNGMYSRKNDDKKKKQQVAAKKMAEKYSEEDRDESKAKLDELRKKLDDCKEEQNVILQDLYPDNQPEAYLWAHKLKKPDTKEMAIIFDSLKVHLKKRIEPDDDTLKTLYDAQLKIDETRKEFKNCQVAKNRIWGIVK